MSELTDYVKRTKERMKGYSKQQIIEMGGFNLYYRDYNDKMKVSTLERINKYMDDNAPIKLKQGRPRKKEK